MTAFDDANRRILLNEDFSVSASYLVGGIPPGSPCRLVRSSPDETLDILGSQIIRATDVFYGSVAEIPTSGKGDKIVIGSFQYEVLYSKKDVENVMWEMHCKNRVPNP